MAKHFYASNEKFHAYMTTHRLNYDTITLEDTNHFYDELTDVPSDIEDEDEKINYYEEFIKPYDPVVMEIDLQDEKTMGKTLHNIDTIHILCPDIVTTQRTPNKSKTPKRKSKSQVSKKGTNKRTIKKK